MKRFRVPVLIALLAATSFAGAFILAHGDGKRAEALSNTADPRSHTEHQSFEARTSLEKLSQLQAELKATKKQMVEEGVYSCCINGGCNMCALDEAECTCRKNLQAGEMVCTECKSGWEAGEGALADYTADDVKASFEPMGAMGEHDGGNHGDMHDDMHGEDSDSKESRSSHDH